METLLKTPFFRLLSGKEAAVQEGAVLDSAYRDFATSVVGLCMATTAGLPAFFSLTYARIEFSRLLCDKRIAGAGEK